MIKPVLSHGKYTIPCQIRMKLDRSRSRVRTDTAVDEEVLVSIDQHFVVKGIGLVGIGYVRSGIIRKHDSVEIYPGGMSE